MIVEWNGHLYEAAENAMGILTIPPGSVPIDTHPDRCGECAEVHEQHHCNCKDVSRCNIFVHPDARVHSALNRLVEEISRFDEETASLSRVLVQSRLKNGGRFCSETINRDLTPSGGVALGLRGNAGAT